ncbi:MAG TPA: SGNH/GDSL hydrolase family protein [Mucilaginibacter sp.]|jgi:lysophospholipase L1-like esterase|nr:SGNH/GDSL hydrolase family protein [Mucilaginibacter sp.]
MRTLQLPLLLLLAISCFSACSKLSDGSNPKPKSPALVVIVGSSTAAGGGASPLDSAWANRIQGVVNKNGTKAKFINLAVAGYTTYQAMPNGYHVANRPAPDTTANISKALSLRPNLVIISFPSNDIADNYTGTEIMHNFGVMTQMLDSAGIQYIVFGTQPRNFPTYNQRLREKTLNDTIKNVYTIHSNDFFLQLSTSTYLINPMYSAGDGIHLNNSGHALIMNATLKQPIFMEVLQWP